MTWAVWVLVAAYFAILAGALLYGQHLARQTRRFYDTWQIGRSARRHPSGSWRRKAGKR